MVKLEKLSYTDAKDKLNIEEPVKAKEIKELMAQCTKIMEEISNEEQDIAIGKVHELTKLQMRMEQEAKALTTEEETKEEATDTPNSNCSLIEKFNLLLLDLEPQQKQEL